MSKKNLQIHDLVFRLFGWFATIFQMLAAAKDSDVAFRTLADRIRCVAEEEPEGLRPPIVSAVRVGGSSIPDAVFDHKGELYVVRRVGDTSTLGRVTASGFMPSSGGHGAILRLMVTDANEIGYVAADGMNSQYGGGIFFDGDSESRFEMPAWKGSRDQLVCVATNDALTFAYAIRYGDHLFAPESVIVSDVNIDTGPVQYNGTCGLQEVGGKVFFVYHVNDCQRVYWDGESFDIHGTVNVFHVVCREGALQFVIESESNAYRLATVDRGKITINHLTNAHSNTTFRHAGNRIFVVRKYSHGVFFAAVDILARDPKDSSLWHEIRGEDVKIAVTPEYVLVSCGGVSTSFTELIMFDHDLNRIASNSFSYPVQSMKTVGGDVAIEIVRKNKRLLIFASDVVKGCGGDRLKFHPLPCPFERLQEVVVPDGKACLMGCFADRGTVYTVRYDPPS